MVYDGRKMIDNTAFFSVMAPYMPLRSFPGLEERGKRKILVTRKFQPSFPVWYDMRFFAFSKNECPLVEITRQKVSLEDVFLELTEEEKHEAIVEEEELEDESDL